MLVLIDAISDMMQKSFSAAELGTAGGVHYRTTLFCGLAVEGDP